jgi:hypothetical protein
MEGAAVADLDQVTGSPRGDREMVVVWPTLVG